MTITKKAALFATVAHAAVGQVRKYSGEPYIVHPIEVAQILISYGYGCDLNLISAAYMHDVVEDTNITCSHIDLHFNGDVADLVYQVTNPSKQFPELNRAARKAMDLEFLKHAEKRAQVLKLADIKSNAPSIITEDPIFAKIWVRESILIIEALKDASPTLYQDTKYILQRYINSI